MNCAETLAVMDSLVMLATDRGNGYVTGHQARTARTAMSELLEASKELQFIRLNGCAAETYEAATARHDAAIARCGGDA